MNGLNKSILIGEIQHHPSTSQGTNGLLIARVDLTVTESYTNRDTENTKTDIQNFPIVFFAQNAEFAKTHLRPGMIIMVEGKLKNRKWDSLQKPITEIVCQKAEIISAPELSQSNEIQHEPEVDIPY